MTIEKMIEELEMYYEAAGFADINERDLKSSNTSQKQHDVGFNIFTTLNIERDEVFTHSNMIYALLNLKGSHGMGDSYLKIFLKEIGIFKKKLQNSITKAI